MILPPAARESFNQASEDFLGERPGQRTVACQCPEWTEDVLERRHLQVKRVSPHILDKRPRSALIRAQWAKVQNLRSWFTNVRLQHPRPENLPEARRADFEKLVKSIWQRLEKAHADLFALEYPDVAERKARRERDSIEFKLCLNKKLADAEKRERQAEGVARASADRFWDGEEAGRCQDRDRILRELGASRKGTTFLRGILDRSEKARVQKGQVAAESPREKPAAADAVPPIVGCD